jgi:uncharacterized protein (TIGR00296 family)
MVFNLTRSDCEQLPKLAREALTTYLDTGKKTIRPCEIPTAFKEKHGVFVTLTKNKSKELRGCIGFPSPIFPLIDAVIEAAISAAVHDPRFPTVTRQEVNNLLIEVSVLTPPVLIEIDNPRNYRKKVKIGVDGLIVEKGGNKGLLLPQVPVEWNWDVEEFLNHCCMKARLPPDAWLLKETNIYKFSCIIVKEIQPHGPIKVIDMRISEKYE